MKITKRYLSVKQVSEYTSLSVKTVYQWVAERKIPHIKIGRRILFDISEIDNLMESLKRSHNQCEKTANKIIGDIHDRSI